MSILILAAPLSDAAADIGEKPPEVARTVAGGRASEANRPPENDRQFRSDPGRGHVVNVRRCEPPPRPLPGSKHGWPNFRWSVRFARSTTGYRTSRLRRRANANLDSCGLCHIVPDVEAQAP